MSSDMIKTERYWEIGSVIREDFELSRMVRAELGLYVRDTPALLSIGSNVSLDAARGVFERVLARFSASSAGDVFSHPSATATAASDFTVSCSPLSRQSKPHAGGSSYLIGTNRFSRASTAAAATAAATAASSASAVAAATAASDATAAATKAIGLAKEATAAVAELKAASAATLCNKGPDPESENITVRTQERDLNAPSISALKLKVEVKLKQARAAAALASKAADSASAAAAAASSAAATALPSIRSGWERRPAWSNANAFGGGSCASWVHGEAALRRGYFNCFAPALGVRNGKRTSSDCYQRGLGAAAFAGAASGGSLGRHALVNFPIASAAKNTWAGGSSCPPRGLSDTSMMHRRRPQARITSAQYDLYDAALVPMLAPFVFSIRDEPDVYYCFETLMQQLDTRYGSVPIQKRVSQFLRLVRLTLPDLYEFFEEEDVDATQWVASWFKYLLSRELRLECVMRLWDTYFSERKGLDLHTYFCLAILHQLKESLEDLESSEISLLMRRLPFKYDEIEMLLHQARNLRLNIVNSGMVEFDDKKKFGENDEADDDDDDDDDDDYLYDKKYDFGEDFLTYDSIDDQTSSHRKSEDGESHTADHNQDEEEEIYEDKEVITSDFSDNNFGNHKNQYSAADCCRRTSAVEVVEPEDANILMDYADDCGRNKQGSENVLQRTDSQDTEVGFNNIIYNHASEKTAPNKNESLTSLSKISFLSISDVPNAHPTVEDDKI